jgi:hypothetical protein
MMNQPHTPDDIVLHADKEHGGIELVVLLIIVGTFFLSFLVVDSLLLTPLLRGSDLDDFRPFLRLVLSVVVGIAVGGLGEYLLKRRWKSGRKLCLNTGGLTVELKDKQPGRIEWERRVNVLCWSYPLRGYARGGRERRVPSSHFLLACHLLQNDYSVIVHTYLSPKRIEQIPGHANFTRLDITKLYNSGVIKRLSLPERPSIPPALLTSKHGQLWAAEKERWTAGLELDPNDFQVLLGELARHGVLPAA